MLQQARTIIRDIDPLHPIAGLNNEPSVFAAYAPCFDVHLADPYPIPLSPISMVADWTDASRKACGPDRPTWMCLQTHDLSLYGVTGGRWPTPEELRCMEYLALIHGAKGIAWWAYGHARDHNWDTYRGMAAELKTLEPYLLSPEGSGGVSVEFDKQTAPDLHASAHRLGDRVLVLLANPGPSATTRLQVRGMSVSRATRLFDYDVTPVADGGFEVSLAALGTAAYVVE